MIRHLEVSGGGGLPPAGTCSYCEQEPRAGDLWLYRDRTQALLRRYARMSVQVGRLPSLLGRECFRARVSSYRVQTFEDAVIFVHDVERCLERLHEFSRSLLACAVLEDYSQQETAYLLGCSRRTVVRRLPAALDRLSQIFLETGILKPLPMAAGAGMSAAAAGVHVKRQNAPGGQMES